VENPPNFLVVSAHFGLFFHFSNIYAANPLSA